MFEVKKQMLEIFLKTSINIFNGACHLASNSTVAKNDNASCQLASVSKKYRLYFAVVIN
jgi:hypothetical protein